MSAVPALLHMGVLTDETLCFSDQPAFPFENWTAWADCKDSFDILVEPAVGKTEALCTVVFYAGGDGPSDELLVSKALELVADGVITDETLCFSDEPAFPFENWTAWADCRHCFAGAPAKVAGVAAELDCAWSGKATDVQDVVLIKENKALAVRRHTIRDIVRGTPPTLPTHPPTLLPGAFPDVHTATHLHTLSSGAGISGCRRGHRR